MFVTTKGNLELVCACLLYVASSSALKVGRVALAGGSGV